MSDDKLKKLFEAARGEESPVPSNTFVSRVVSAIAGVKVETSSPFELIAIAARQFLAPAMAAVILLACGDWLLFGGDWGAAQDWTKLTDPWFWTFYS